ncbi:MBL fold metallo-hydrolase [Martelella radicis]|uniref:Glyoxylase-like metal-dependent hydrolase (Beta-lactamase superfamily II) n=1 Tax=Martelella radicis TaxID=1397476 RepID=A0A7W6PAL1_9HYPH|nr:MBL fold metallo-hydrolase [Martelella radicis]MBB4121542.1 glyoxylase-like metal-dependent hydrolase (beta-lactamase superfamily II) [Martelella radicis]
MREPEFEDGTDPAYGRTVRIADGVFRLTAKNPSPFTFHGTNGYLIGQTSLTIIDPGPDIEGHFDIWIKAIAGRKIDRIALTHTHLDHTPMAHRLRAATGAPILAFSPHRAARPLHEGEENAFSESSDTALVPDITVADGERFEADGFVLQAVHTPGHTANHLSFALEGTPYLFSGDHVMGWSTTIVAPPDGAMGDYMASLEKLLARPESIYLPGHGGPVNAAHGFIRGIRSHRLMRERAILERLAAGDETIAEMVRVIYRTTNPALHGAAALSVLAHLEALVERGSVSTEGPPLLAGRYRLAS